MDQVSVCRTQFGFLNFFVLCFLFLCLFLILNLCFCFLFVCVFVFLFVPILNLCSLAYSRQMESVASNLNTLRDFMAGGSALDDNFKKSCLLIGELQAEQNQLVHSNSHLLLSTRLYMTSLAM